MIVEYLGWPVSLVILIIYGFCSMMSILFTFFPGRYNIIEERLNFSFTPISLTTSLDIQISTLDYWAKQHNKEIGIVLSIFSIFNLVSFARILII